MIQNENGKFIHFGSILFSDYTKHLDKERQKNYLARATKIKGNWKDDKYSPNNLSLYGTWGYLN
jgi:hypothetical protein